MLKRIFCCFTLILSVLSLSGCYDHLHTSHAPMLVFPANGVPDPLHQCVSFKGQLYCGYNCMVTAHMARCAPEPAQTCIANEIGEIECGFACMRSGIEIRCTTVHTDRCVKDHFGHIKCGKGCDCRSGKLHCQTER